MSIQPISDTNITTANIDTFTISPLTDDWFYRNQYQKDAGLTISPLCLTTSQLNSIYSLPLVPSPAYAYNRLCIIKYVIAGDRQEYEAYIRKKGYSDSEYVFVDDASMLEGKYNVHGYYVGSWRDREDIELIKSTIVNCNMKT